MSESPPSVRRLARVVRLQLWLLVAFGLLWTAPVIFGSLADEAAAYRIRVDVALHAPTVTEWFGTDASGRSQWHRTLIACRISLRVVGGSLLLALPVSLVLGALAGALEGRWPDHLVCWLVGLLHTLPFFLLVVAIAAIVGPGTGHLPWIIGAVIWAPAARLVREETIRLLKSRFILASRAGGQPPVQIYLRTVCPLTIPSVTVALFYLVPEIIGVDAILTLFGLGPQPPTPSLGSLIFDGVRRWDAAPWLAGMPCLTLLIICLVIHQLADRISAQLRTTI